MSSPLSSIADKSISRSIQKRNINVDPRIFEMNPYEMAENQERTENRRSLRHKSHKK